MTHTKGPWRVTKDGTAVHRGDEEPAIAVTPFGYALAERRANARLIAAAPLLLEALHNAVMLWAWSSTDDVQQQWLSDARAALAAARQESAS